MAKTHTTTEDQHSKERVGSLKELLLDIAKSGERIPAEERARIPRDASTNVDHYLYGSPKEEE